MQSVSKIDTTYVKEKKIKFLVPFLFYLVGLACYLSTLVPYIEKLMLNRLPKNVLNSISHLDYIITFSGFFLLIVGFFVESFIMCIASNFLGARVKYRTFLTLFTFANLPIALKFIVISIKNVFVEQPGTYLIFKQNNPIISIFDLFNIGYMVLLFILLKYRTDLNSNIKLGILLVISLIYRLVF